MLAPGDAQNDAPETKFNRRNDDIVKRVKVIAPTDQTVLKSNHANVVGRAKRRPVNVQKLPFKLMYNSTLYM